VAGAETNWLPEHFVGGHPALDLANAVFDRHVPEPDNELFKTTPDIANWFRASGLAEDREAAAIAEITDESFIERVHAAREASASTFGALAAGQPPAGEALSLLFSAAARGFEDGAVEMAGTKPLLRPARWRDADAVTSLLAMLSIEALFTLPRDRLRSCPRCGWLFLDTSRGGQRRWCSMRVCGNREKLSRHKERG
jgi:predicted RNA-binding Zn ribbon-like protein